MQLKHVVWHERWLKSVSQKIVRMGRVERWLFNHANHGDYWLEESMGVTEMGLAGIQRKIAVAVDHMLRSAKNILRTARLGTKRTWVRLRYANRLVMHQSRRLWRELQLRLLSARVRWINMQGHLLGGVFAWSMTLIAIIISIVILIVQPPVGVGKVLDHIREVNLACAGIAGTALALILTLSITPAQKAGEAFSQAILKLYVRDRALWLTFILLSFTCLASLLAGTGWNLGMSPYSILGLQFLLMGISFDALRYFHTRTVRLLLPETAINLVLKECIGMIDKVGRHVDKAARIIQFDQQGTPEHRDLRARLFNNSRLADGLKVWVGQFDEFAHKAVVRGDTQTATGILDALAKVGGRYAHARKESIVLAPNLEHLLAGDQTEVNDLLHCIHESIYGICQHSAKLGNELIATHCIRKLGGMAQAAMHIVIVSRQNWSKAPLTYNPVFFLDLCLKTVIGADMQDAQLEAVGRLRAVLLSTRPDTDTREAEATALDGLFKVALAGAVKSDSVVGHPAMAAMLNATLHVLQTQRSDEASALRTVLEYTRHLIPFEVAADVAGHRRLRTFPPYSMAFEANLVQHLEVVADTVQPVDPERSWIDPFSTFLEVTEQIRSHYRKISDIDFKGTLLIHWVLDSIINCCCVHVYLIEHPPRGAERFLDGIKNSLCWMIYCIRLFFQADRFQGYAKTATDGLAKLGMSLIRIGQIDLAVNCGEVIALIGSNCTLSKPRAYDVADHFQNLEILVRAATVLGHADLSGRLRGMLVKPENLSAEEWARHKDELAVRIGQLDEELQGFYQGFSIMDNPTSILRRIIAERNPGEE